MSHQYIYMTHDNAGYTYHTTDPVTAPVINVSNVSCIIYVTPCNIKCDICDSEGMARLPYQKIYGRG